MVLMVILGKKPSFGASFSASKSDVGTLKSSTVFSSSKSSSSSTKTRSTFGGSKSSSSTHMPISKITTVINKCDKLLAQSKMKRWPNLRNIGTTLGQVMVVENAEAIPGEHQRCPIPIISIINKPLTGELLQPPDFSSRVPCYMNVMRVVVRYGMFYLNVYIKLI